MIEIKNVNNVSEEIKMNLLEWRNSENVRKYFIHDDIITKEEHSLWIASVKKGDIKAYVVYYDDIAVGLVYLPKIFSKHKTAEIGLYIYDERFKKKGIAQKAYEDLINMAFNQFGIEKLFCKIISTNVASVNLHKKIGFKEEGLLKKDIVKSDGLRHDVILMGLLKDEHNLKKND